MKSNTPSWNKVVVFNPDNGDLVQLNIIRPEQSGVESEPIKTETAKTAYHSSNNVIARFGSSEFDGIELLQQWKDNKQLLGAVALSDALNGQNLQWYEPTRIAELNVDYKPNRRDPDNFVQVVFEKKVSYWTNVIQDINLVHKVFHGGRMRQAWRDENGDGVPDGYTAQGFDQVYFNPWAEYFDGMVSSNAELRFAEAVILPVEGLKLTYSADIMKLHAQEGLSLRLRVFDITGTEIADAQSLAGSVGRQSVDITLPAGAWSVVPSVTVQASTADNVIMRYPALRTDESQDYPNNEIALAGSSDQHGIVWDQSDPETELNRI